MEVATATITATFTDFINDLFWEQGDNSDVSKQKCFIMVSSIL